jgi:hypothetical protein
MKWWQPKSHSEQDRDRDRHHPSARAQGTGGGGGQQSPASDVRERIERLDERTDALLRDASVVRRESEMTTEAIRRDMKQRRGK